MPNRPSALPFAAALMAAAILLASCKPPEGARGRMGKDGPRKDVKAEKTFLSPTFIQRVRRGDVEATVSATGSLVPIRSRMLRAQEAGKLLFTKEWKEGDVVAENELIATIQSESLDNEIELAQRDVDIQTQQLAIGQRSMNSSIREFRTLQDLYSRGIAAKRDVDRAELEMQRAINQQEQNRISLERAKARLDVPMKRKERLDIRAPFMGVVVSRGTLEGREGFLKTFGREAITDFNNRIVANEFAVCGVVDPTQMLMRTDVTAKDISRLSIGQRTRVTLYATQDIEAVGRVQTIAEAVNPETRAFTVDVLLDNPQGQLKPGMFGRTEFIVETRRDTVWIPKAVIVRRNERDIVFVAERPADTQFDVAREREVTLGLEGREDVEVLNGLREGDRLVVRGFELLQDLTPITTMDLDAPTTGTLQTDGASPSGS